MNPFEHSNIFIDDGLPLTDAVARYQARRQAAAEAIGHISVIFSVDKAPGEPSSWVHLSTTIYQEPLFLYLTGLNQFPCVLVLNPLQQETYLFLPHKDPKKEFWDGIRFGYTEDSEVNADLAKKLGVTTIFSLENYEKIVSDLLRKTPQSLGLFWHESQKQVRFEDSNYHQNAELLECLDPTVSVVNIAETLWKQRFPLDGTDLMNAQIANTKTIESFLSTLKKVHLFSSEQDVSAYLNGQILSRSWFGNSFPNIIASGENGAVLHYSKNNAPLQKNGLLLMDFGLRWQTMHADISRTIPVSGTFNPMQALLYQIVLDTQIFVERLIKPGMTISGLNAQCWTYMDKLLDERFLSKGGKMTRCYESAPHNVGHFLGMQVHDGDPFREYREQPLEAGFMLTNEPGLYGYFEATLDGQLYQEPIGIRIEDNLWVTPTGCVNLSAQCPKTIAALEKKLSRP